MTNKVKFSDFYCDQTYNWCTNCGNYAIHSALKRAFVSLDISNKDALICFDIGCHGNGSDKINTYTAHCLHGRIIPYACGASVANPDVKVVAIGGDGGMLSEGINHLIHAIRCDYNVMVILSNNKNYGLTTGQASALTPKNVAMNSSPDGVTEEPLNHMDLIFTLNPSFVARGFSGEINQLTEIFKAGLTHKGFSFVEVLQDCPTYNKATPHQWYLERIYNIEDQENYDPSNLKNASLVASDYQEKIATGVIYQNKNNQDYASRIPNRVQNQQTLVEEVQNYPIEELLENFR